MLGSALGLLIFSLCCCRVFGIYDPSLPVGLFYPFGPDQGDSVVPVGRLNYSEVLLSKSVVFDKEYYEKLYVETCGVLAFGYGSVSNTPSKFPIADWIVAPYWAGADTSLNTGRVYYRETDNSQLLNRAVQEFRQDLGQTDQLSSFLPQKLFIATWHNITFNRFGNASSPVNSFQAILAWNCQQTAVSYRYGKLTWTTGGYSGGNVDGVGGVAAEMGYNSGNSDFFFAHEWSMKSDILQLANYSNVGVVGRYSYRIDRLVNITDCNGSGADAETTAGLNTTQSAQSDIKAEDVKCSQLPAIIVLAVLSGVFFVIVVILSVLLTCHARKCVFFGSQTAQLANNFTSVDEPKNGNCEYCVPQNNGHQDHYEPIITSEPGRENRFLGSSHDRPTH